MTGSKKQDRQLWKRMGRELAFLDLLIVELLCDSDYNILADKKTWGLLSKAHNAVTELRGRCEVRAFHVCPMVDDHVFYGLGDVVKNPLERVRKILENDSE